MQMARLCLDCNVDLFDCLFSKGRIVQFLPHNKLATSKQETRLYEVFSIQPSRLVEETRVRHMSADSQSDYAFEQYSSSKQKQTTAMTFVRRWAL